MLQHDQRVQVGHHELLTWLKEHGLVGTALDSVMTYGTGTLPGDPAWNVAPLTVAAGWR